MSALLMGQIFKYATDLSGTDLLMLLALADCADDEYNLCWPSAAVLAQRVRISQRQAQRVVAKLVADGYVEIAEHGGGSRSNRYRVLTPATPTSSVSAVTELCRSPYDTQMSYEPSYNHQEELIEDEVEGTERKTLSILAATPEFKFDYKRDLKFVRDLMVEFPTVDIPQEARRAQVWLLDHPGKVKNFRLFYRNWIVKGVKDDRPKPKPKSDDPWEGIPESDPIPAWMYDS
jgi:hypothetical protein